MKHPKSRVDGAKLRRLRKEMGLNVEELAADTAKRACHENKKGVSGKTIARMEQNGRPHPYTLARVADALGVEPKDLLMNDEVAKGPLSEHLCDFGEFIENRVKEFVGRKFIFDAIDEYVENNECGYFFVRGEPGVGKSSIAAKLVRRKNFIHHFNIRPEGRNTAELFTENICSQLIREYELGYSALPVDSSRQRSFLMELLKEASGKSSKEKLVIVIDALDEVQIDSDQLSSNVLYLPMALPANVFFFVTMREDQSLMPRLLLKPKEIIIKDDSSNRKDLENYICTYWDTKETRAYLKKMGLTMKVFSEEMAEKSGGNFMYLKHVLPEIVNGTYCNLNVDQVPAGLINYYDDHWKRMGVVKKQSIKRDMRILYILSETTRPISCKLLSDFASEDTVYVQQILDEWSQYLHRHTVDNVCRYSIYHASFQEYLKRKDIVKASGVDIDSINVNILNSFEGIV